MIVRISNLQNHRSILHSELKAHVKHLERVSKKSKRKTYTAHKRLLDKKARLEFFLKIDILTIKARIIDV